MVSPRGAAKFGSRPFGIGQRRPGWRGGFAGAPSGNPQDRGTNGKSRIPGLQKYKRLRSQHEDAPQAKQGQGRLRGGRPSETPPMKKAL